VQANVTQITYELKITINFDTWYGEKPKTFRIPITIYPANPQTNPKILIPFNPHPEAFYAFAPNNQGNVNAGQVY